MPGFTDGPVIPMIVKVPAEKLDYSIDFSALLSENETIQSSTWTIPSGLTVWSASISTPYATQWLSGGTAGTKYTVTDTIVTNQGRTFARSFQIAVIGVM